MAVWEVRAVFQYGDRFWENVWEVDVGSLTDVPSALLLAFETFHLSTLLDLYTLVRIVRRPAGTTDEFIETLVGTVGANEVGSNHVLPLWNTVRLLLQGGAGRPGSKFLRGFLTDAMIADELFHIDPAIVSAVETHAIDLFNAASDADCSIVFGAGFQVAVSPVVQASIQMRQPHRKRRRAAP
jgi:hypothetical protein